ncbi:MAG: SoxR reducing system RseC family protein [Paludibacteraceae bacterium]|nr:SoxR reducing system RseC family protein [Paludibacteraceae bacterium]
MSDTIEHKGIVESVSGQEVHVRIVQASACSACHAAKSCMAADAREKYIDCLAEEPLAVGDDVMVSVSQKQGWLAVLLSFVLPFLLLMLMLWLTGKVWSEAVSGTVSICSLLPYYLVIWLFRDKLRKRFNFIARKQ